jgi:hypothetical protein
VETADGVFFNPPDGFPQIHVVLGDITIDNRDQSNVNIGGSGTTTPPGGGGGNPGPGDGGDNGDGRGRIPPQAITASSSYTDYERRYPR